jgi:hypothetical protein
VFSASAADGTHFYSSVFLPPAVSETGPTGGPGDYRRIGEVEEHTEKMILEHKPVPGYRRAFYIVMAVGIIYLMVIFGRVLI